MRVPTPIVGAKFYAGAISKLASLPDGTRLTLMREPDNKYDKNAVSVWVGPTTMGPESQLGHIPREVAKVVAPQLDTGRIGFDATYQVPNMVVLHSVDEDIAADADDEPNADGFGFGEPAA